MMKRQSLPAALAALLVLVLGACTSGDWQHRHGLRHPDVGRIIDTASGGEVTEEALIERLRAADYVLLGEKHDNADHHALQARLTASLGPKLDAVVFEMMSADQQEAVTRHLSDNPGDLDGLARVLNWQDSGWPPFALYRPIIDAGLAADALIAAGNLSQARTATVFERGTAAFDSAFVARTGLDRPLAPRAQRALVSDIVDAHCGYAPDEHIRSMVLVQRARDAMMADRLARLNRDGISVLIAGAEHVRNDRGVPLVLERLDEAATIISLGFREVGGDGTAPADLPFDYVWLTPRAQPVGFDPCEAYREQLEDMAKAGSAATKS